MTNVEDNLMMQNYIEIYLDKHKPSELNTLIEKAIERKSYRETPKYEEEYKTFLQKLLHKTPKASNFKIEDVEDEDVIELENACPMLQRLKKRVNLIHLERTSLLFIYMQLGNKGEVRLRQIMQQQDNYRENITNTQINQVKNKKRIGISCEKLIEWCVCSDKECKYYKKIESNV